MKQRPKRKSAYVPTINPLAVRAYLNRDLDSFDDFKEASEDDLMEAAHNAGHRFATDCWHHQLVCFSIGMILPEFLFFLEQGGGKSKVILDLIRYRKRRGELKRALVVVPYLLHASAWEDQIKTHAPDLTYSLLLGDKADRERLIDKHTDICVMNHAGLMVYMSHRQKQKAGADKGKTKTVVHPVNASEFACRFNFVVYDESHHLGSHRNIYYELGHWLSTAADFRYAITGTPFGRDPHKLWTQFYLVDKGATLGTTLGIFRSAFFTAHENYWGGIEWDFNERMTPELHRVIKHRSITYRLEEMRDMPAKIPIRLPVQLSAEAQPYYRRIVEKVIEARGDYRSLRNSFTRMRQCASGFLSLKADDESRIEVEFKENAKLDALMEFIQGKGDEKIIVFHEFTLSGRRIEQALCNAKIGHASIRGETRDPIGEYRRFLSDPKCRIFVLNNSVGAEAINPQMVCRRAVFYESPVDPIKRAQAEARVHRPGQQWTTFIYDLVVKWTIEEKILRYLKQGQDLLKAVLEGGDGLTDQDEEQQNLFVD